MESKERTITLKLPPKKEKAAPEPRYVRQKTLLEMYGFHYRDLMSLEVAGLKRIQLEPGKRVIFYDLRQFDQIMAKLSK